MSFNELNQLLSPFQDLEQQMYTKFKNELYEGVELSINLRVHIPLIRQLSIVYSENIMNLRNIQQKIIFKDDKFEISLKNKQKWVVVKGHESLLKQFNILDYPSLLKVNKIKIKLIQDGSLRLESEKFCNIYRSSDWLDHLNQNFTKELANYINHKKSYHNYSNLLENRRKMLNLSKEELVNLNLYKCLHYFKYSSEIKIFYQLFFDISNNTFFISKISKEALRVKSLLQLGS